MSKFNHFIVGIVAALLLLPTSLWAQNDDYVPTIFAGLYSSSEWTDQLQQGIYSFPAQSGATLTKVSPQTTSRTLVPLGGAAVLGNFMHGVYYTSVYDEMEQKPTYQFYYVRFDTRTWELAANKAVNYSNLAMRCNAAVDPTTNKVYGLFYNFDLDYHVVGRTWATVDYESLTKTKISDELSVDFISLAINNEGQCYGIDANGYLYSISKDDAVVSLIGDTQLDLNINLPMCADFDPVTDKLYWVAQTKDGKSGLYTVGTTTTTCAAQLVNQFANNEVLVNMWIPDPNKEPDPSLDPGYGIPTNPTNVTASYANGTATVTWEAPLKDQANYDLNADNLTYNIVRQPDNKTVATAVKGNTWSETLATPAQQTAYYYQVEAVNGDKKSEKVNSNSIILGASFTVPYSENFNKKTNFDLFSVIDANNDGSTWKYIATNYTYSANEQYACIEANKNNADDDYLLTPAIILENGNTYKISFDAKKSYGDIKYNQKVDVLVGEGTDPSTYKVVAEGISIEDVYYNNYANNFTITADGEYHIAFHAVSNAYSDRLILDNIKLVKDETAGINNVESNAKNAQRYNLSGQRVGKNYKGIVIVNGKKVKK